MATNSPSCDAVSVVITNFNTWPLTLQCVGALHKLSGARLREIVIVDDYSSTSAQGAFPPNVRLISNESNLGYVASVNVGVRSTNGAIIVLLDSDARPLVDVVSPCRDAFCVNPGLGALSFRTVDEAGSETGSSSPDPDVLDFVLGQKLSQYRRRSASGTQRRLYHSCALAFRRTAFEAVGGFDEDFDFLDADLDFSVRLYEAGWAQQQDPGLLAIHSGGGSPQSTATRVLRFHRNRWRFLAKHNRLHLPVLVKISLMIRHAIEYAVLRLIGRSIMPLDVLQDKLAGRRALLHSVMTGYGNE